MTSSTTEMPGAIRNLCSDGHVMYLYDREDLLGALGINVPYDEPVQVWINPPDEQDGDMIVIRVRAAALADEDPESWDTPFHP
ncbi:MAG TPA: hypothetical protein VF060_23495 [Trebonia sp.]